MLNTYFTSNFQRAPKLRDLATAEAALERAREFVHHTRDHILHLGTHLLCVWSNAADTMSPILSQCRSIHNIIGFGVGPVHMW